jgi:hypothetical protein
MSELIYDKLVTFNHVYQNSLQPTNTVVHSPMIKTTLYPHQNTLVHGMHKYYEKMTRGFVVGNQTVNGKMGIIGDSSGTGKTLSVLAYLASINMTFPQMSCELANHSSTYFFSHQIYTLSNHSTNLIIVPQHLFGQWRNEIETHTSIPYVPIETKRILKGDTLVQSILNSRFVLTTNKCYHHVQDYATEHHIQWNNIFIDEASSIYLHSSMQRLPFQFLWLISNNWIPLLFKNPSIIKSQLYFLRDRVHIHPELEQWLLDDMTVHYEGVLTSTYLKDYMPFFHALRGYTVIRNLSETIRESMMLPRISTDYIQCRPNINLHSLAQYYQIHTLSPVIQPYRIPYLFQALCIPFKSVDEYILQNPRKKLQIQHKVRENECMICLDPCTYPTIVNCCYQLYCGACLLKNTLLSPKCPTCRSVLGPINMCCMASLEPDQCIIMNTKMEICLNILQTNKDKQIIIYSAFDNIYYQLFEEMDKLGLKVERIENNLFSLRKTIQRYQQGITNVIFISNVEMIRGLSLPSTSHLIFYHELPVSEWKEVLIHSAQRLGRTEPLQIVHLNSEIQV